MAPRRANPATREKLVLAAQRLMLAQGFSATSVEDVCRSAGLTKGAFFHYFESKEKLGQAAVERWLADGAGAFRVAPFLALDDPLERVFGYVDFTVAATLDAERPLGCLVGMFSQERSATDEAMRALCRDGFSDWAGGLREMLEEAAAAHQPDPSFDAAGLADLFVALYEGALILAKTRRERSVVAVQLGHYKRYLTLLFPGPGKRQGSAP